MARRFKNREKHKKIKPANHGKRPNWRACRKSAKKVLY